jgi:Family of unknown function (DUF6152)
MKCGLVALVLATAVIAATRPMTAHHSFAAQYDRNKPVTLTGPVTKLQWANPHIYFFMDVKDGAGAVSNWAIEGGAPNTLYRAGWRKDSVKIGEVVTVHGYLARDGSKLANLATAVLADGRNLYNGQENGRPPGR